MKLMQKLRGEMETERLLLRKWKLSDFNAFVKFNADREVMAASGVKPASSMEAAETNFHRALRNGDCYAIVLRDTNEVIGQIKFQEDLRRHETNSLSIAYQLCRDQWGKGYMPEALRAMIACGFEKKKASLLAVSHFSVNHRSQRVVEKCGFHYEGTLRRGFRRYDGEIFDELCYSILREEYLENKEKYLGSGEEPVGELPPGENYQEEEK